MYDILIIGAGPGGYVAAIKAAQLGAKVAIIEKENVGGVCLNHGCIPTKTYLKSAKTYKEVLNSQEFGINVSGETTFDWQKILKRKNDIVKQLTNGVSFLLKKNKIDVFNGFADVLSSSKVKVNDQILETKKLVLATGASPIILDVKGAEDALKNNTLVTYRELLNITEIPKNLVIIGGGVVGVEFATIFNTFGSKVTIIEKEDSILSNMDLDIKTSYTKRLKTDQIDIITQATITKMTANSITYVKEGNETTIDSDLILMAAGTKSNLQGLEKLELKLDRSNVVTNEYLETNIPNVYAIGDLNGKYKLAHVAMHEGIIAVGHALGIDIPKMQYDKIPACIYGAPEIATIGLTEKQAKEKGLDYKVAKVPLAAVGKAMVDGQKEGFVKMIVGKKYLDVLGVHIYAYNATELISNISITMELEGTAHEIAHAIFPHPTLSELTMETALAAIDKAIHI